MAERVTAFILGLLAGFLLALFIPSPALPHDFYSLHCCSNKDCKPAVLGDVMWTPAGYQVQSTGETIPLDDARIQYSPPGEPGYRLCIPFRTVRCLYVPEPEG